MQETASVTVDDCFGVMVCVVTAKGSRVVWNISGCRLDKKPWELSFGLGQVKAWMQS